MICSYLYSLIKCSAFRKGDPFLLSDTAASADTKVSQLLLFSNLMDSFGIDQFVLIVIDRGDGGGRGGG